MIRHCIRGSALLLAGAALASCADIGSPLRSGNQSYEFRQVVAVGDTLSFHWPESAMPITFWAEDTVGLPEHADSAIAVWQRQFLYHEFTGSRVADSATADVIIRYGPPPNDAVLIPALVDACQAATDMRLDAVTRTLALPMHVYIAARFLPDDPGTQDCFRIVMIHELGHVLGILRHSNDPLDIMYGNPTAAEPTTRDRNTVQVMYHWPVNVTLTGGGAP
ncbi:MAG TPA: matrixin family metalloprotease [Gemmatimonadales bacterium]|jgi:predicted Zn-dependent protease|nr:matrixin family metalloprotease [Gemmatimonadales bacterium]